MTDHIIAPDELQFLSGQFTYPVALPCAADQARMGAAMEPAWGAESSNGSIEALQAKYVRLFINALPEVPCPPPLRLVLYRGRLDGRIDGRAEEPLPELWVQSR